MNNAYLLLGGNQGHTAEILRSARKLLGEKAGIILQYSALYKTAAWGKTDQPDFLNQALLLHTTLGAAALLLVIQEIETLLGRQRNEHWGSRTLDIDILLFNDAVITSGALAVPHPELQNRRFALVPLCDIAAAFRHPVLKKTMQELLDSCSDNLAVLLYGPGQ